MQKTLLIYPLILIVYFVTGCNAATPLHPVSPKEGWDDLPAPQPAASDWPWWRGPSRNDVAAADQSPPLVWSEKQNVVWRVSLPGRGHGTPCLWGDRMFLPTADEDGQTSSMLCLDRDSGKVLWQKQIWSGKFKRVHAHNSYATATAACDGERVFLPYPTDSDIRLIAFDLDGNIVWNERLASFQSIHGYAASPCIYKSAVIVPVDGKGHKWLCALHRKTGKVIWRVERAGDNPSYGSPMVVHVAGKDQLLIIGPNNTRSYDPDSGRLLWECRGPADYDAATVAFNEEMIFSTGGYPQRNLLAIRADGTGDVTATHVAWQGGKKAGYVPSPLYHDGLLFAVSDVGLLRCYDAASGDVKWEENLRVPFYSSPVLVGRNIYLFDRQGKGYVFAAADKFELVAENTLPSGVFSTPVISKGRIYLRTLGDFYCLGD